jgi:hypothetical protein
MKILEEQDHHLDRQRLLRELEHRGVEFSVKALGGGVLTIGADELLDYLADPDGWYARQAGVARDTVSLYRQWQADDYQCMRRTKRGARCKNVASRPHIALSAFTMRAGWCALHLWEQKA